MYISVANRCLETKETLNIVLTTLLGSSNPIHHPLAPRLIAFNARLHFWSGDGVGVD